MRNTYQRVFQKNLKNNPELLAGMLSLRLGGWKYRRLAEVYRVDKSTIRHWCDKYGIQPQIPEAKIGLEQREEVKLTLVELVRVVKKLPVSQVHKYQALFDEEDNVNPGKSYAEYVAEAKKRRELKKKDLHF